MKIFISHADHRAAQIALFGPDGWKIPLPAKEEDGMGGFYEGELEFNEEQAKILRSETEKDLKIDYSGGCETIGDAMYNSDCRKNQQILLKRLDELGF